MINVNWSQLLGEFADLARDYQRLPGHIAKKHLLASMRRAIVKSGGVKALRANTPPLGTRRGRRAKGAKPVSTGELRKSVTTKAKWIGRNADGAAVGGLGYRFGFASQKAIWNEFGTQRMPAKKMMERTFSTIRGPVASALSRELAAALEKATAEVAAGKNKGYKG